MNDLRNEDKPARTRIYGIMVGAVCTFALLVCFNVIPGIPPLYTGWYDLNLGTFQQASCYDVADFNLDGYQDLAVASWSGKDVPYNWNESAVSIWTGGPDGLVPFDQHPVHIKRPWEIWINPAPVDTSEYGIPPVPTINIRGGCQHGHFFLTRHVVWDRTEAISEQEFSTHNREMYAPRVQKWVPESVHKRAAPCGYKVVPVDLDEDGKYPYLFTVAGTGPAATDRQERILVYSNYGCLVNDPERVGIYMVASDSGLVRGDSTKVTFRFSSTGPKSYFMRPLDLSRPFKYSDHTWFGKSDVACWFPSSGELRFFSLARVGHGEVLVTEYKNWYSDQDRQEIIDWVMELPPELEYDFNNDGTLDRVRLEKGKIQVAYDKGLLVD